MADNRYANAKCFVFSPDGYQEITYEELCRRREIDTNYQERKFIPLHGMLMEVTADTYRDFYTTPCPLGVKFGTIFIAFSISRREGVSVKYMTFSFQ